MIVSCFWRLGGADGEFARGDAIGIRRGVKWIYGGVFSRTIQKLTLGLAV